MHREREMSRGGGGEVRGGGGAYADFALGEGLDNQLVWEREDNMNKVQSPLPPPSSPPQTFFDCFFHLPHPPFLFLNSSPLSCLSPLPP
eukprot:748913-Hanusia_phi.AAC.2